MCGSGTLLWEACEFYRFTKRTYAYEHSPLLKTVQQMGKPRFTKTLVSKIEGRDLNEQLIKELPSEWKVLDIPQVWEVEDASSSHIHPDVNLVLCNPPYDERLTMGMTYQNLIKNLQLKYPKALIGVLMSSQKKNSEKLKINPKAKLAFSNSGIDVDFYLF